jgi:membrane-associated phospholipid phosphatase
MVLPGRLDEIESGEIVHPRLIQTPMSETHPPVPPLRYRLTDYATQGYLLLVGILILFFHNETLPRWSLYVVGHGVGILGIHALILSQSHFPKLKWLHFLRSFYPILIFTFLYSETGLLNQLFYRGYLDPIFIRLDQACFGSQPSLEWMARFPQRWVSELLYGSYFSYYLMVAGVGLGLYFKKPSNFQHYLTVITVVFYGCYLTYIFLPVIGPHVFYLQLSGWQLPESLKPAVLPPYPETVQSGFFYRLMDLLYQRFETPGAAFPSSHVAAALCTVHFSFKHFPAIRWVHASLAFLLCLATVYCRYHYLVDVFAGVITAVVLISLGEWLYRKFEPFREPPGEGTRPTN